MYSDAHKPKAPALPPVHKTFGVLALAVAAVNVPLFAMFRGLSGSDWSGTLASAFAVWLGFFGAAAGFALFAVIGRYLWITPPPKPATYPGIIVGLIAVGFYAVVAITG